MPLNITALTVFVFFFGVVTFVGFAAARWKRGDLDWVRAVSRERAATGELPSRPLEQQPVLSA